MKEEYIRHYTDLTSLISVLKNKEIVLVNPKSWDDKNDSDFIELYKKKKNLKTVLALCFSQALETYHHWSIFAKGSSGVCIKFKRSSIQDAIKGIKALKLQEIKYLTLKKFKADDIKSDDLPFIKRSPFKPEKEIRLLWESATEKRESYSLAIDINCIDRVTISPWLNKALYGPIKEFLKNIEGCKNLKIYRSTIVSSSEWYKYGTKAK